MKLLVLKALHYKVYYIHNKYSPLKSMLKCTIFTITSVLAVSMLKLLGLLVALCRHAYL